MDDCKKLFTVIKEQYPVEYKLYGLGALSIPIVLPRVFYTILNFGYNIMNYRFASTSQIGILLIQTKLVTDFRYSKNGKRFLAAQGVKQKISDLIALQRRIV